MFLNSVREYDYIIQIYINELRKKFSENLCHEPLECSRGITVSLLHYMAQKRPYDCAKCCIFHVIGFHAYLLIHIGHVQFTMKLGMCDIVPDHILIREQREVLHSIEIVLLAIDNCS